MLMPAYRGMRTYKTFMHERTKAAISYGATICTFLSVKRPVDHHLKPNDYHDLKPIWNHYGFIEHLEVEAQCSWKDIDQPKETKKSLAAWVKAI